MSDHPLVPTVVYGFDPLCGWCFAFRGVLQNLRRALADRVNWDVACGCLITGEREQPIGEQAEYLLAGEEMLREAAGVSFGRGFVDGLLADGRWVSRSEPPCRAILLTQRLFGSPAALALGDELIRGFYEDGAAPDLPATITTAARHVGVDAKQLLDAWERGPGETAAAIDAARSAGVRTYPSLFLQSASGLTVIHEGFSSADHLLPIIESLLKNQTATPQ